jgi:molybdopterin-biosynthesis enzyme MoeA-like protein
VPLLKKEAGKLDFFEKSIFANHIMESNLAPLIDEVMRDNLYVYIKSHVYVRSNKQPSETRPHIELHFSTTAENRNAATERLNKAIEQLSGLIRKNGGKVKTADSV